MALPNPSAGSCRQFEDLASRIFEETKEVLDKNRGGGDTPGEPRRAGKLGKVTRGTKSCETQRIPTRNRRSTWKELQGVASLGNRFDAGCVESTKFGASGDLLIGPLASPLSHPHPPAGVAQLQHFKRGLARRQMTRIFGSFKISFMLKRAGWDFCSAD